MQITVEISLYPLTNQYGDHVIDFIKSLKENRALQIRTNSMSTQITGQIEVVMHQLTCAMEAAFKKEQKAAIVMKCFNSAVELEWLDI